MSSLLTPEHRLLLACLRTDLDVEYLQHAVERGPDWQAVARKAMQWGVAALIYERLQQFAAFDQVPAPLMQYLKHLCRQEAVARVAQRALLCVILRRCSEEGIPVLVLHGAAHATAIYLAQTGRAVGDIDLLVHAHDRARAAHILRAIAATHSDSPVLGPHAIEQVTLHEHFSPAYGSANRSAAARFLIQDVWKRARAVSIDSVPALVLSHEDQLLHLALQVWAWNGGDSHMRTLWAIGELCRRAGNAIDWGRLVAEAQRYQVAKDLAGALYLARKLVGADVPASARAALRTRFSPLPFADRFRVAAACNVILSNAKDAVLPEQHAADGRTMTRRLRVRRAAPDGGTTLVVSHNAGLTSCLSVRLHDVAGYWASHGRYPEHVDSSQQFQWYADYEQQNVAALLLAPVNSAAAESFMHFHYGYQFAWYRHLDLPGLQRLARKYCWPAQHVVDEAHAIMRAMRGRTAVLYRGNDKIQEIPRTPYETIFEMAERSGSQQFWVQTDEADFFDAFKARFPDTRYIERLPMIRRDDAGYVLPATGKAAFAATFLAALYALAHAPQIICTTGNTALWTMIFRGHTRGVWQHYHTYPTYVYGEVAGVYRGQAGC